MYINQDEETRAQASGWTYESGYNQGFQMGKSGQSNNNYFPKHTNAWHGHKEGFKDGRAARKRGY